MPVGHRTITTAKCQQCPYERTIDTGTFPDIKNPIHKVTETGRWHARQHHHDVLITTINLAKLNGSSLDKE
jgi:hypothetical protein